MRFMRKEYDALQRTSKQCSGRFPQLRAPHIGDQGRPGAKVAPAHCHRHDDGALCGAQSFHNGLVDRNIRAIYQHRLTHSYAVMEPALHRLIGRFGVTFNQIGPKTEYHGLRIPCLCVVNETLQNIKQVAPSVWDLITERGRLLS